MIRREDNPAKLIVTMTFSTTGQVSSLLALLKCARAPYGGQEDDACQDLYQSFGDAAVTYSVTVQAKDLEHGAGYAPPAQAEVSVFLRDPSHLFRLKRIVEEGARNERSAHHQAGLLSMIPIIESASVSRCDDHNRDQRQQLERGMA